MDEKAERSWGVELWDQSENLMKFVNDQNTVSQNYAELLADLQKMHQEIAKKYRKTISPYMPKKKAEVFDLSYQSTFFSLAQSYYDMANYHDELANNLSEHISSAFKTLTDSQKQFIAQQNKKRQELFMGMEDKKKALEKSWVAYVRAHKEKIIARDQNSKALKDEFLPRVELKKYDEMYNTKRRDCDSASMKYATDLRNYNESSTKFHNVKMMEFINDMEELEVDRCEKTKDILERASDFHLNSFKKLLEAVDTNKSLTGLLDDRKDRVSVLNKLQTELFYPAEAQFLDLDKCPIHMLEGPVSRLVLWFLGEPFKPVGEDKKTSSSFNSLFRSSKKKEEMVSLSSPFFGGLGIKPLKLNEFTVKQLDKRIVALTNRSEHLIKEKDASSTMENIYSTAPSFGNADSVEKRVAAYNRQLRSLELIRDSFEKRYQQLGGDQAKIECLKRIDQNCSSSNASNDSAYRSESEYDSIENVVDPSQRGEFEESSEDEASPVQAGRNGYVGRGKVLYQYDGNGDSYLPAVEGQVFEILEFDDAQSGWTAVFDPSSGRKGFVPTNFIEITKY